MTTNLADFDFLDFGCSDGGSMAFARDHLGATRGLGLDIDERKIATAKAQGFTAEVADLSRPLEFSGKARFVIMSHFLEHVPYHPTTRQIIETACAASRDFVMIRHPWFDSDAELALLGVKCFWSDWSGHINHMTSLQLYLILLRLLRKGAISGFRIFGHVPVTDTGADCLIPLQAPQDQHHYNLERHGAKASAPVPFPCFRELVAVIGIGPAADLDPPQIIAKRRLLLESPVVAPFTTSAAV